MFRSRMMILLLFGSKVLNVRGECCNVEVFVRAILLLLFCRLLFVCFFPSFHQAVGARD